MTWEAERERIHFWARHEWRSIKQRRKRLYTELVNAVENGSFYLTRETLPPVPDNHELVQKEIQRYLEGDISLDDLEEYLETSWERTQPVDFDDYLRLADEIDTATS